MVPPEDSGSPAGPPSPPGGPARGVSGTPAGGDAAPEARKGQELAARASQLLREHPILWMPPIIFLFIRALLLDREAEIGPAMGVLLLTIQLILSVMVGGWLEMGREAMRLKAKEVLGWSHFQEGLNRHVGRLVLGTLLQWILVAALLAGALVAGQAMFGTAELEAWLRPISHLPTREGLDAYFEAHPPPHSFYQWMGLFGLAAAVVFFFTYLLAYWQAFIVLDRSTIFQSWYDSARLALRRWRVTLWWTTFQGLCGTTAFLLKPMGPLGATLGYLLVMVSFIYFGLLALVVAEDEHPVAPKVPLPKAP